MHFPLRWSFSCSVASAALLCQTLASVEGFPESKCDAPSAAHDQFGLLQTSAIQKDAVDMRTKRITSVGGDIQKKTGVYTPSGKDSRANESFIGHTNIPFKIDETNEFVIERAWGYEFSDWTNVRGEICSEMWDGQSVRGNDSNNACDYVTLRKHWTSGNTDPATMCLRNYSDLVSTHLKAHGQWGDCASLAFLWTLKPARKAAPWQCSSTGESESMLFVDVGANIGACTMMMLPRPDVAQVVAFEPNPANQFYLTSSVLKNPAISSKLKLFPDALGSFDGQHKIYVQPGNAGNTVLDKPIQANPSSEAVKVATITLDEVFLKGGTAPYIHVMKLDAQGYEVKILKGGSQLLAKGAINAIKFELAPEWLIGQGTSTAEFLSIFVTSSYDIYPPIQDVREDTNSPGDPLTRETLASLACSFSGIQDFLAIYNPNKTADERAEVVCK